MKAMLVVLILIFLAIVFAGCNAQGSAVAPPTPPPSHAAPSGREPLP